MTRAEGVVGAFAAAQEAGGTVRALDARERIAASRQRLVPVGLMTDVPYDAIVGGIEDRV